MNPPTSATITIAITPGSTYTIVLNPTQIAVLCSEAAASGYADIGEFVIKTAEDRLINLIQSNPSADASVLAATAAFQSGTATLQANLAAAIQAAASGAITVTPTA